MVSDEGAYLGGREDAEFARAALHMGEQTCSLFVSSTTCPLGGVADGAVSGVSR